MTWPQRSAVRTGSAAADQGHLLLRHRAAAVRRVGRSAIGADGQQTLPLGKLARRVGGPFFDPMTTTACRCR